MATDLYLSWWFQIEGQDSRQQKVNLSKAKAQLRTVCKRILDMTKCDEVPPKKGWILKDILEHEPDEHWDRDDKVRAAMSAFREELENSKKSVIGANSTIGKAVIYSIDTPHPKKGKAFSRYLETFVFSDNMSGTVGFLSTLGNDDFKDYLKRTELQAKRIVGKSGRGGSMMVLKQAGSWLNDPKNIGSEDLRVEGDPAQDEEIVYKFLKLKDEAARKLFARIRVIWKIPNASSYMDVMNKVLAFDSYLDMMDCMREVKSDLMVPVAYAPQSFAGEGKEKLPQNFRDDLLIYAQKDLNNAGASTSAKDFELCWSEPLKPNNGVGRPTKLYKDQARLLVRQGVTLAAVPPQKMKRCDKKGKTEEFTRNGYYLVNLQGLRKDSPFTDIG